jgi:flavin-dependent dehydrogenase
MFRVVIIGAGPAGSVAATLLARAGLEVTVIESRAFPRIKVCGEYISPAATSILESILTPRELLAAGSRRVNQMVLEAQGRRVCWKSPASAWSLSRASLDSLLLNKAVAAGATLLQPAAVHTIDYQDDTALARLANGTELSADLVVHADGSGRHDPAGPIPHVPGLIAHKCHLHLEGDPDAIIMRSCPGAYIGTIGVERGLHTCALVARRELCTRYRDIDSMVAHLWPDFRPRSRQGPWKSSGVPRSHYIRPGHPRSIRIGNAAAAVDPVGGEGIGLALWAGAHLGRIAPMLAPLAASSTSDQLDKLAHVERELARGYQSQLRLRKPICQLTAWAMMRPRLVRALWPLAMAPSLSFGPFYRLTGKAPRPHPDPRGDLPW